MNIFSSIYMPQNMFKCNAKKNKNEMKWEN